MYVCFKKGIGVDPRKCEKEKKGSFFLVFFFLVAVELHAQTVLNYSSIKFYI